MVSIKVAVNDISIEKLQDKIISYMRGTLNLTYQNSQVDVIWDKDLQGGNVILQCVSEGQNNRTIMGNRYQKRFIIKDELVFVEAMNAN